MIEDLEAAPHSFTDITLKLPGKPKDHCYLKLTYYQKAKDKLTQIGHELGFDQFALSEDKDVRLTLQKNGEPLTLTETPEVFRMENSSVCYEFGKKQGSFLKLEKNGKACITAPVEWNVYRAPTDNDRNIVLSWKEAGYDRSVVKVYGCEARVKQGTVAITCDFSMAAVYIQPFLRLHAVWSINGEGEIKVAVDGKRDTSFPFLPRFGLKFHLPQEEQEVTYLGYGPHESYCDKHQASYVDVFHTTVPQLHVDYVRPQENGSHYNCSSIQVGGLQASGSRPFSFSASEYTIQELEAKHHNYELEPSGSVIVCTDYKQSGVGSNSCGPELLPQYRLDEDQFHWEMLYRFE